MKLQYTVDCPFAYSSTTCDFTGLHRGRHEHKLMLDVSAYVSTVSHGHDREKQQGVGCMQVGRLGAMLNIGSLLRASLRIYDQIQLALFVQALV